MSTLFYFKIEPMKGYIPSDKVTHAGQAFESAGSIIPVTIQDHYKRVRKEKGAREAYKAVKDGITGAILVWLQRHNTEPKDPSKKQFYINFNMDGLDVFISRWNWKENN